MYVCMICHFDVQPDDIAVEGTHGNCICLKCYERSIENEKPMNKRLRQEVTQALEQGNG